MKKLSALYRSIIIMTMMVVMNFGLQAQTPPFEVTVIQPSNAGMQWVIGSTNLISWTDNFVLPVKIELTWGAAGTYSKTTIKGSAEGSTYSWNTTGIAAGSDYRIKVSSTIDASYADSSDYVFALATTIPGGAVRVIQPSVSGISWVPGTTHLISWEDDILGPVKIELLEYKTDGVTVSSTITLQDNVVGSTWPWNITQAVGNYYKIRVSSTATGSPSDESDQFFSIGATQGGTVTVIQPSESNIVWKRGTSHLISWKDELVEKVKISLYKNGVLVGVLAENVTGSAWVWPIDAGAITGIDYKIRVSSMLDGNYQDYSDENFSIVDKNGGDIIQFFQPLAGQTWVNGNKMLISWEDEVEAPVDIDFLTYIADGATLSSTATIKTGAVGSTYLWTISAPVDLSYRFAFKIRSADHELISGQFNIVNTVGGGVLQFFQPLGGENWNPNTTYLISWEDNILEGVDIYVSSDGGNAPFTKIPGATNVTGSTYLWNTGGIGVGSYKIRIVRTGTDDGLSSVPFNIINGTPGGSITINQPNDAGLIWVIGQSYLISWDDNLVENVRIDLEDAASPGTFYNIALSATGTALTWTIPTHFFIISGHLYKVKVSSATGGSAVKFSDNTFQIVQQLMAVYPNPAGETVTMQFPENSTETYTMELFDRYGTIVMQGNVNTMENKEVTLQTYTLPNGIYFLNMTSGQNKISKKIVIQH